MKRLTGQGLVGELLAKDARSTPSLGQKEQDIADRRLLGKGTMGDLLAKSARSTPSLGQKEKMIADRRLLGKGTGSFLLDGGMGGQSSYTSPANYTATTGRVIRTGGGLEKLSSKLSQLNIKPKKQNIKFDL
jgi:hypothetical protein